MPIRTSRADLLQRALDGERTTDPEVGALAATAAAIPRLSGPRTAPRPEFIQDLGARLQAEALTLPVRPRPARRPSTPETGRPVVLVIGRGLPRLLAGVTASLLAVAALVGVVSRGALPGGLLYPVKELLDSAAVQLAGSDLDRGNTLLAQGQEHLSDAVALVDHGDTSPAHVDEALTGAYDAVNAAQRTLLGVYERDHNPQALLAVQDFATRALPQLEALRPRVQAGSVAEVDRLIALLQATHGAIRRKAQACGPPCAALLGSAPGATTGTGAPGAADASGAAAGGGTGGVGVRVPGVTAPGGALGGGGASVGPSGGTLGAGGGGVSASLPGATVPVAGTTATVPAASGSVGLPSASVGAGGAGLSVPSQTLGSVTLPGASATVPVPTVP